MVVMFYYLVTG